MSFNYSVNLSDSLSSVHPQDGIVSQALGNALAAWSPYINGVGTLNVQLTIADLGPASAAGTIVLASAKPTTYTIPGPLVGGVATTVNSAVDELTTGQHLAGSDITINVNSEILPQLTTPQSDNITAVLEHELAHGFGISGYRLSNGQLGYLASAFDNRSVIVNGLDYFTGPAASFVYGGVVPLTTAQGPGSNYYHVGVGNGGDPPSLSNDLMYWLSGPGRSISALDVAILEDVGIPISAAGQALIDPSPTITIAELAGDGVHGVVDAAVGGTTQPDEVVIIVAAGRVLGTVRASEAGQWSLTPTGLDDGTYVIQAEITGPSGVQAIATQTVILDTTDPLDATYEQVLGFDPDAASLAAGRQLLESGDPLQSIRAYLANSGTAANVLSAIYLAVTGAAPAAGTIGVDQSLLANGDTLAAIRAYAASSGAAFTALAGIYQSVLGQPIPADSIAPDEVLLAQGQSLTGIRTYLASTGQAFTALNGTYQAVLGQPIPAGAIAPDEVLLAQGQSLAGIQSYLAYSPQAISALAGVYRTVLGQAIPVLLISQDQTLLAQGQSLAGIQTYLSSTSEAFAALDAVYRAVLGTPIPSGVVSLDEGLLAQGQSLSGIQTYLSGTGQAFTALNAVYQAVLGQPIPASVIGTDEMLLAQGQSLAGIRTYLSGTGQAFTALNAVYQAVFGQPIPTNVIATDEGLLAQGQTLAGIQAYLATTQSAALTVTAVYQSVLGRTPTASELASAQQSIASGGSVQAVAATLVNGPELANDISTATQAQLGRPANAVELAADRAEIGAGLGFPVLQSQLAELHGMLTTAPYSAANPLLVTTGSTIAEITPQTVAGPSPNLVYGLLHNDALIAAQPETVTFNAATHDTPTITGFDPMHDVIQIQSAQAANFASLVLTQSGGTTSILFGPGAVINLQGVAQNSLTAADFRFV